MENHSLDQLQTKARQTLKKYWGYDSFRPLQEDIILSVLQNKDTLALLPTGGGKSICFQVPAMVKNGVCIVISPLIALMNDQVNNLSKRGIKAVALHSGLNSTQAQNAIENCIYGNYKFLYLSPEKLSTEKFKQQLKQLPVSFIAIDEAHCISQWGYDFRPPYLKIADIRELLPPETPFLALTATATPKVVNDIQEKLKFKSKNVFQKSFERKNLAYLVFKEEDKLKRMIKIFNKIPGCGIVYARSRKETERLATYLKNQGVSADFYHAGLSSKEREKKQNLWIQDKTRIMVATNAFGMGIDKPDVRVVLHLDLPDSLESYFQEAGRAGRDEKQAYAILLYSNTLKEKALEKFEKTYPSYPEIKSSYYDLAKFFKLNYNDAATTAFSFPIYEFCKTFKISKSKLEKITQILEKEEYIKYTDNDYSPPKLMFKVNDNQTLIHFYEKNPKFESLIKTILRSYTGVFDYPVEISEKDIAQRANLTEQEVKTLLEKLVRLEILYYKPESFYPEIQFTSPIVPPENFYINRKAFELRKQIIKEKLEYMIFYAASNYMCRSRILLGYFGEYNSKNCGQCDVCLHNKTLSIEQQIYKILKHHYGISSEELLMFFDDTLHDEVIEQLRILLAEEKISYINNKYYRKNV